LVAAELADCGGDGCCGRGGDCVVIILLCGASGEAVKVRTGLIAREVSSCAAAWCCLLLRTMATLCSAVQPVCAS